MCYVHADQEAATPILQPQVSGQYFPRKLPWAQLVSRGKKGTS